MKGKIRLISIFVLCALLGSCAQPVILYTDGTENTVWPAQIGETAVVLPPAEPPAESSTTAEPEETKEVPVTEPLVEYVVFPELVGRLVSDLPILPEDIVRIEEVRAFYPLPRGVIFDVSFTGKAGYSEYLVELGSTMVLYVSDGIDPNNVSVLPDDKTVYLTFDDGPSPEYTLEVLDILDSYGVSATFFLVGESVEKYPEIVEEIHSRGHKIGCHSYSHVYNHIYASAENMLAEIERWEEAIEAVLGFVPEERLFRFPGGSSMLEESVIPEAVAAAGYRAFDWNALNNDSFVHTRPADMSEEDFMKDAVITTLAYSFSLKTSPHIVLMHDTKKPTAELLPWMIEYIKEMGCTFATLETLESGWLH